ncbi:MAG: 4'-phosphopantetheinyl transferase superfamily protein [Oscillospiraceae bacterium]|nr:4'-phosphopantetheinyl transferase superfamily protein [Oscillospiraceae bacterium]
MLIRARELQGLSGHAAGRQLLEEMYRSYTGKDMPPICVHERGKPYFAEGELHFSVSHTKRRVFCVLSAVPVGIDAEELDRDIDLRLGEKILSPREKERFACASDKRDALLRLWVLKEASAKLTGEGLRGYPNHTDLSPEDPRIQVIDNCYVAVVT